MTHSFPTRRASDLDAARVAAAEGDDRAGADRNGDRDPLVRPGWAGGSGGWAYQLWRRALFHDDHDHDGRLWRHRAGDAQGANVRHHCGHADPSRSEEHTSELQSLMRTSYAVFCWKKKKLHQKQRATTY